jgi:hypothetical protein
MRHSGPLIPLFWIFSEASNINKPEPQPESFRGGAVDADRDAVALGSEHPIDHAYLKNFVPRTLGVKI